MASARLTSARPTRLVGAASIAGGLVAVAIAIIGPASAASATPSHDGGHDKVWVCKYVDVPGQQETLKNGNGGLIEVSASTLKGQPVAVGASFADDQGRSLVVQIGGPRPAPTMCPGYVPPPTTPAPDPTTTTPAPDPTTTPAPDPTTTPAPDPTTTSPAPDPTTTSPAPDPTTTSPAPDPTTTSPAPDPTTTTPASTTPAPDPTTTTKVVTEVLADDSASNPPDATAVLASTGSSDLEPLLLVGLGAIALGGIVLMESRRSARRARG